MVVSSKRKSRENSMRALPPRRRRDSVKAARQWMQVQATEIVSLLWEIIVDVVSPSTITIVMMMATTVLYAINLRRPTPNNAPRKALLYLCVCCCLSNRFIPLLHAQFKYWCGIVAAWIVPGVLVSQQEYMELRKANTYQEWVEKATEIDRRNGAEAWKMQYESSEYDYQLVHKRLQELRDCRRKEDWVNSAYLLRSTLDRNLGDMGSVNLFRKCRVGTKDLVEQYIDEVEFQLNYLCDNDVAGIEAEARVDMFVQIREGFGRSALLLSGGAGLGMHHFGVIKTLHEAELLPRIISGSSAGALVGALVCVTCDKDLGDLLSISTPALKSHYLISREGEYLGGWDTLERLLFKGYLADVEVLKECCKANFGDTTFQEAYDLTHRILNITVNSKTNESPRLLNYLTSPNVVIWSAACASCALSGIFSEVELMCKNKDGELVPWSPHGMKWSDGSIETDLPMQHLREMFNVNHFIVSQVNPHVTPVLSLWPSLAEDKPWWFQILVNEISHRLVLLIEFGVFPALLRRMHRALTQEYTGDITIVPDIGPRAYLGILSNPTPDIFERAVRAGERAAWPKMGIVNRHLQLELALEHIVERLRGLEQWKMI